MRAFSARDLDAIRALADAGLELDTAGGGGLTTLMRAVLRGDGVAVEWILAAGADAGSRTADGKAALDFAREIGRNDLVELLIAAGASAEASAGVDAPKAPAASPETMRVVVETAAPEPTPQPVWAEQITDSFADQVDDHFDDLAPEAALAARLAARLP